MRLAHPSVSCAVLIAGLVAAMPAAGEQARPGTGCPLIRPSGLTPGQVDAVVLGRVAQAVQQAPDDLDTRRTLLALVPPEEAERLYGYAALAIGEALGFDAWPLFRQLARAQGSDSPHQVLSIAAMQAAARAAYAAAPEAAPPAARPGERYRLDGVQVAAPTLDERWHLMRCGHDQVAWWRRGDADDESVTAVLRITAFPPWSGPAAFAEHLREALLGTVPVGYAVRSLTVEPLADSRQPCAEARLVARSGHLPWRLRARFCLADAQARHGHAALFSHAGSDDVPRFEREAEDFLAQVQPDAP